MEEYRRTEGPRQPPGGYSVCVLGFHGSCAYARRVPETRNTMTMVVVFPESEASTNEREA